MFKCDECDYTFDKPEKIADKEYADYGIGGMWITVYTGECCPNCGSEEFEVMKDEDDCVAEPSEVLGVGLQQAAATADDRQGVA